MLLSVYSMLKKETLKETPHERLGWNITSSGSYTIDLPQLSMEEEKLIIHIESLFREKTREQVISTKEESEQLLKQLIISHARSSGIYIDSSQSEYLSKIASLHFYGFCFIDPLLEDKEIEEISVIGVNKPVYVYVRNKGWQEVNAQFSTLTIITDAVNKMAHSIGRRITLQHPRLDAMLPNGDRLHASLPPISQGEITIRRFKETPFSPRELCENNTIDAKALAYLSLILQGDNSVILAGNTASGKTTLLNALFGFVPLNERIIVTEETPEIKILHPHTVRLVANKEMGVSLHDLVYDSFRMRPDRVIVGEIRNAHEANALFDVLLAGQARGSYATMHAHSAEEGLQRLKSFGIKDIDLNSIDCLVIQKRMVKYDQKKKRNYEIRRVIEIAETTKNGLHPVFSYDYATDSLRFNESMLLEEVGSKLGLRKKEVDEELASRVLAMKKYASHYPDFFSQVQKQWYGLTYAVD